MIQKPRAAVKKPPPHTDEAGSSDRKQQSADRRPPPEPFEECGPSGGYGGAGTDEAEDED